MADRDAAVAKARLIQRRVVEGPLWVRVDGQSMGRAIPAGSEVFVVAPDRAPRIGEVWVFLAGYDELVAHRFFRRSRAGYVFRGDAESRSDRPVAQPELIGRVTRIRTTDREFEPRRRAGFAPFCRAVLVGLWRRFRH